MSEVMLGCGHSANATDEAGNPVCAICIGLHAGATVVVEAPDLTGRTARCVYCKRTQPSSLRLAFFTHLPGEEFDEHYDGCRGWS